MKDINLSLARLAKHDQSIGVSWSARDLMQILNYEEWRNFENVIDKAKVACRNSGQAVENHFVDVNKMVSIGYGNSREGITGQGRINETHRNIGQATRKTIAEFGGTPPELLPTVEHIDKVKQRQIVSPPVTKQLEKPE